MEREIVVVEDDEMMNRTICFHLESAGYKTISLFTYSDAMVAIQILNSQLFIVDVNLPDGNGVVLCGQIKKAKNAPVIILTANDLEEDIINGFDAGASDYVTKPFSMPILLRRVNAVLQHRNNALKDTKVYCGNLQIDLAKGEILKNNKEMELTQNEWKLLDLFIQNEGQLLTRNQILQILWDNDGNFVSEHTLTTLVSRLRSKLSDKEYSYIKTYYGLGYRWVGDKDDE